MPARFLDRLPYPFGRRRHFDAADAEFPQRVNYGVDGHVVREALRGRIRQVLSADIVNGGGAE
jgi:hypothetical protein